MRFKILWAKFCKKKGAHSHLHSIRGTGIPEKECGGGAPDGATLRHCFLLMKITSFLMETSVENRVKISIRLGELKIYFKELAPPWRKHNTFLTGFTGLSGCFEIDEYY